MDLSNISSSTIFFYLEVQQYQNEIKERLFTDWSMGFNRVEDKHLESIEGYNGLINAHFFADKPGRAVSLLESFRNRS